MTWLETVQAFKAKGEACVLVTVARVRGHAPRAAGAKMVVAASGVAGSIGGGNLEEVAVRRARAMLESGLREPVALEVSLTSKAGGEFGVQCCGGEVMVLLEPLQPVRPQVAIFGAGHVGLALARILSRLPVEILLSDSRPEMLEAARFEGFSGVAALRTFAFAHPSPEFVLAEVRSGGFVFVLTHDHLVDLQVLESALGRPDLAFVGLIGSGAKWSNFKGQLRARGFSDADLARVTTPIGVPGVVGKHPEVIAVAAAAQVLGMLEIGEGSV